jgi:hypothetical protein
MHSKVMRIAAAGVLLGALLFIAAADGHPDNGWRGGARNGLHHVWHRSLWRARLYGFPYGDYWPPYAGYDCFGSIRWRNAFCY